ncbi:transcriptional regulator, IclR family protein [Bacillus methanolicus PB1]|uniref:Transcriptional regulator, IclR family protein n=1 Tax=Bacillus methanolicus PB1 TaxID=997296 RepID=I3E6A8_BACMT|nr:IclR family transcriptional regulator [Bacillus methanolicus]EIJ82029.1 transcriptional regulator, IclR family protein [Bacillus methanolicus PB1]
MSEVIRKTITLLTAIKPNEEKEEWSATEISRKLNIPVQTVHRLLSSLEEYGFVFKDKETKKFRLGLTLMQLGFSIRDNLIVRNNALPIMEKLVNQTRESVYLTVPEGSDGIFVDCINAPLLLKVSELIGLRAPLCVGASNKVILAYMNRSKKQQIIQDLIGKGKIKDIKKLEEDLKFIKEWGGAISFGEITERTVSVAAPIFSWEDKVIASISVIGPDTRFTENQIRDFISLTQRAAEEISEELGWIKRR